MRTLKNLWRDIPYYVKGLFFSSSLLTILAMPAAKAEPFIWIYIVCIAYGVGHICYESLLVPRQK